MARRRFAAADCPKERSESHPDAVPDQRHQDQHDAKNKENRDKVFHAGQLMKQGPLLWKSHDTNTLK
jgi:hypothetical protein